MKVFPDTNVLVAAFIARGLCADLFREILKRHQLVVVEAFLDELQRKFQAMIPRSEHISICQADSIPTS